MTRFATGLILALSVSLVWAQEEVEFKSESLAEGLSVVYGVGGFAGGNILISTGPDGTVMIDDSMPPLLPKLKVAIKSLGGDDLTFLINTHLHGDHTGNNASFAQDGAHLVAHHKVRERLKADSERSAEALPVITFNDEIHFHLNGQPAQVMHLPAAHTDGDAAIYFPEVNVLHTGDLLFNGIFPFIDLENGGSVQGYIDGQRRLLDMAGPDTVIVPGHGPAKAGRADLERANTMLRDAYQKVSRLVAQGKTEDEILALNPLAGYHDDWSWGFITTEKMTRTLYQDLTEHRHGTQDDHQH